MPSGGRFYAPPYRAAKDNISLRVLFFRVTAEGKIDSVARDFVHFNHYAVAQEPQVSEYVFSS